MVAAPIQIPAVTDSERVGSIIDSARLLLSYRNLEMERMNKIHAYLHGNQSKPLVPRAAPTEVKALAEISNVNIMDIVVSSVAQAMYVDGYRGAREAEDAPPWEVWQANALDARQTATHRACLAYGAAYVTVLPGDPLPVIKGYSPRKMTVIYGDDDYWPRLAMRTERLMGNNQYEFRVYDERAIHLLRGSIEGTDLELVQSMPHDIGVVPVVRFVNKMDADDDIEGEIEPLMSLQDQINLTTFSLLVAQHFGAFKQKAIIGWLAENEQEKLQAGISYIQMFEDTEVKLHEWSQTDLKGYLDSREASIRHAASLSQTPAHELLGQLVNLSAEALVAAEASQRRKVVERQQSFGESWEQVLQLAGQIAGFEAPDAAQVRWRDTESRALSQTVDALGKMAQMLGVPPQELWERIPNVSQADVDRWKARFEEGGALANLTALLDRQMGNTEDGGNAA